MTSPNPRDVAADAIESAIVHLADALHELDRVPVGHKATMSLIAHALNNYVSVADAVVNLLSQELRGQANAEVTGWLSGLGHLGTLMRHTITRLVHTSTPADLPLQYEAVELATLFTRACDYHRANAARKQLQIVLKVAGPIPDAWADRVAVAVVADNLLSHAIEVSRAGGLILVQVLPGPGGVTCTVRDQGPGFTEDERSQIFTDRHAPSWNPTDEPLPGFGLSIARDMVQHMRGRFWFDTEPGRGSSASFSLPYTPPQVPPAP